MTGFMMNMINRMKKTIAAALIGIFVVSVFAGCSVKTEKPAEENKEPEVAKCLSVLEIMPYSGKFVEDGSDEEVEKLLDYIRAQGQEMETNEEIITFTENEIKAKEDNKEKKDKQNEQDELLLEAVKLVVSTEHVTARNFIGMNWLATVSTFTYITIVKNKYLFGCGFVSKPRNVLFTAK